MPTKLAADFLERAERSGLVAAEKLSQLLDELGGRGVDVGDPQAVADALVGNETLTRWQADNLLQGKHKGFFLGSYRLLRPLGRGGMGTVYLAQHEMMRRRCAVKVLPQTQLHEGSSILGRFYVEAQAVAAMDHQNIVRAYDVNKETKDNKVIHYLVMEYVEGQDLQAIVQESGPLDYIKTADYLRQTANGLAHAHESRLVHRDIKPANLLVDKKGVVKILDLGLARLHDDSAQAGLTSAHNETVLGTADYLSPEQALNSHDVDHRTDLYSLGCTAYFMLTGHPPFPEGSVAQRLVAHQCKTPTPLLELRRDAPRDLVAIVEKMMAKDPDERYQSGAEISTALAGWLLEHGGEDWRRQHSEIVGDSGLLSLLKQREPTRAMSSSTSETELELTPIDANGDLSGTSGSRIALTPRTSERRPSDSKTRKLAASSEVGLADIEEKPPSKSGSGVKRAAATTPEREKRPPAKATASPVLEPLPELDSPGSGALGGTDLLGALDAAELMGVPGSGAARETAADDWLKTATPGPMLASPVRRPAPEPPKGLLASVLAVGLPVLIGGGGGIVLVAIVIVALFLWPVGPTTSGPGPQSPVARALAPEEMLQKQAAEETERKKAEEAQKKIEADAKKAADAKQAEEDAKRKSAEEQQRKKAEEELKQKKAEEQARKKTEADAKKAADAKRAEEDAKRKLEEQQARKQAEEEAKLRETEAAQKAQQEALGEGQRIALDFKWDDKAPNPSMLPLINSISGMLRQKLDAVSGPLKLKFVNGDAPATLHLRLKPAPDQMFLLTAKLECSAPGGKKIEVWTHEDGLGQAALAASQKLAMERLREDVTEFTKTFQAAVKKLRTSAPAAGR